MGSILQFYRDNLLHFSFLLEGSKALTNLSYASCNSQCCSCFFQFFFFFFFQSRMCFKMILCTRLVNLVSAFLLEEKKKKKFSLLAIK